MAVDRVMIECLSALAWGGADVVCDASAVMFPACCSSKGRVGRSVRNEVKIAINMPPRQNPNQDQADGPQPGMVKADRMTGSAENTEYRIADVQ